MKTKNNSFSFSRSLAYKYTLFVLCMLMMSSNVFGQTLPGWAKAFSESSASMEAIQEYIDNYESYDLTEVDNFKKDSDTKYHYEGIDYAFRERFYPAKSKDQMLCERGAAKLKSNGIWYVKGKSLKPGESVMITMVPTIGTFAGLIIGNQRLDIGNYGTEQHAMPLLFRTGPTEWELKAILAVKEGDMYLRMVVGNGNEFPDGPLPYLGKPVTIIATRGTGQLKNKISWRLTGAYANGQGSYIDDDLPEEALFGLVNAGRAVEPDAVIVEFRHGKLKSSLPKLPPLRLAPWVPELVSERQTWDQYNLRMLKAKQIIKNIKPKGIVTQQEIEMFKEYYKQCGLPHSNIQNCNVFSFDNWNACLEFYRMSGDVWFLNHAVKIAERILLVGVKSEGVLLATVDGGGAVSCERFAKMPGHFPHFRRSFYNDKGELLTQADVAQISLMKPSAAFCKLVADDKSLWNKTIPDGDPNNLGKTYKERSLSYLDKLHQAVKYMNKYRLEPETYLYKYPRDRGVDDILAFNRWFLAIVSLPEAASALETFAVHPERVELYDKMVQSAITFTKTCVVPVEHEEGLIWTWPYRAGKGSYATEDIAHGCATMNGLRRFYESGRYDLTHEEILRFIRPYRYLCYDPKTETFSSRTSGNEAGRERFTRYNALRNLIHLGTYFPIFDEWTLEPVMRNKPEIRSLLFVIQRRSEIWGVE